MEEFSILIGGKAGFGIDKASSTIAGILNQLSYRIYLYRDYPSLIRGGHTFSIVRASPQKIAAHKNKIDFLLALNQDTLTFHKNRLKETSITIYDSDTVKADDLPGGVKRAAVAIGKIIKEENASEIMRNTCMIGSFCKAAGIGWAILEKVLKKEITKEIDLNLKVARRGFNETSESLKVPPIKQDKLPVLNGSETLSLGLIAAGLKSYIAYPMTPSSNILHFMANVAKDFGLIVMHPESEIGVIMMALGASYAGKKTAVGTSGGGFCLMTEGLSFAGMSELPIVIILGQRPGPSTGLPTYSSQTEMNFAINAGQGEFTRLVAAPSDAEDAYFWGGVSLNLAWKYQIPAIILMDKTIAEGAYSFDRAAAGEVKEETFPAWDRKDRYKRYLVTETGVSPLAFVPGKDAIIKINSYEHDESGITTEDPAITKQMQETRLRKEKFLIQELERYKSVGIYGKTDSDQAILCWGSNKGVSIEVAEKMGLKVITLSVLCPFPVNQFKKAVEGVKKMILVENSATGQLANLINRYGFKVDSNVLKYDGRPFTVDELEEELGRIIK
ncbi:MAG: pyruvate ferredoxin oxidoreductase [Omnitrophica bacterium RIFCSPLOWO2_01_FULL_45_10]|nr:MAG: pyruvate ferredoxin oxidoreductase [Omnitrophica bacterium RIFCSPLOWO2_01_FULL_45_10]